ncbi:hypothetical protein ACFXG4_27185 [Nocardia sp. NPDC059246]|uniref:VG15 protein n=1 Tax=unclassified Nocardia TaxID=2637762 RepID=UPI0036CAF50B
MTAPDQRQGENRTIGVVGIDAAAYLAAQAKVTANMTALLVRMMRKYGIPLTAADRERFAQRLFTSVQIARGQSYVLATSYMVGSARAAGELLPEIAPIEFYSPAALVAVLERTTAPVLKEVAAVEAAGAAAAARGSVAAQQLPATAERAVEQVAAALNDVRAHGTTALSVAEPKVSILDRRTGLPFVDLPNDPSSPKVIVRIGQNTGAAVARHAHQAGRDAVIATAENAGREIGWARVTNSMTPCWFCAMLTSRGPVYRSEQTADFRAHDNCECRAVLVYSGKPWDGQQQYQKWNGVWDRATARKSGKGARKAFARAVAAEHRKHREHIRALHAARARQLYPHLVQPTHAHHVHA